MSVDGVYYYRHSGGGVMFVPLHGRSTWIVRIKVNRSGSGTYHLSPAVGKWYEFTETQREDRLLYGDGEVIHDHLLKFSVRQVSLHINTLPGNTWFDEDLRSTQLSCNLSVDGERPEIFSGQFLVSELVGAVLDYSVECYLLRNFCE